MATPTHRLLLALALAGGTTGCAFFGSLVHGGTTALGAAGGAAVGGPAGAAVGGIAGFYGGDLAAEQLSGTRSVRVGADGKAPSPAGGGSLTGAITQAAGIPNMNTMLLLLAVVAVIAMGGPAAVWTKLKAKAQETDGDRIAHKARTQALEAECARLRKEIDEMWDRLPPRG